MLGTHSSHLLAQAIRKSVTGTAAKVINILDYTTPLSELISELKKNFQKVTGIATAWQKFYSASQTSKESLTDWRTRVHYLYHMTENKSDTDAHLKTKLFTGLFNNKLKEILLFKYRDDNASEDDLYQLLREESDKLSVISASVMSNEDTLTKKVEDLSKQLTALKTNQKSKMRTLQEDVDKHTLQLMEEEDTLSDTDENDDSCHCAYQMPRGRQNTSTRYDTQHQDQRRYPQAGYDRRYDTAKVPEQQSSDKQQHYRDDRRYNQRNDAHYNPSDDRLHNQSYDRQYHQSSDRPYYPSSDRRYNQSYDRPYGYQRDQHYMNRPYNYGHQREEERQFCGKPEYYGPQRYNYTYSDGNTNNNRPFYHNNHYQGRYDQRSDDDHTRQDFRDYGKTTFSSLDLVQGFHQQELEESSKQYTAFNAGPLGLFEYQRLPFGITNATASFQRMMEYVLCDLVPSICLVYIDDVIVHSYTPSEHLESLRKVFDCLRFYNLKLKPSKCAFFKTELKFLGHVISDKGLKADPDKITAIKEWPQPKSVKQVRQFLGLSGFIRRYIKDYAIIARPITNLLRGYSNKKHSKNSNLKLEKEQFIWGKEQQAAFNKLKQVIAEDVTLAFPNFDLPFRLSCDASRNGLGGWLEQIQPDGKYRPIAFASRKTSNAERQYPVHKIEFLALKWCVTEKFRDYLYGKEVIIYTDNNPLTYILKKSTGLDATCQRWVSELEPYNFTIEYKPGVNNVVADSLSRI